jgi:2-polyprenyl-3-methyl-5-hydroxy-6-metoxy-1,4-benzoquinol methylase
MSAAERAAVEHCACPLCGVDQPRPTPFGEGPYRVSRCSRCRLWYLSERMPEAAMLAAYADDAYFEGGDAGYTAYQAQEESLVRTFARLLDRMAAMGATGGSVLDVGCGYGYFLKAAAGHFERRCGTDYSPRAAEIARGSAEAVWTGGVRDIPVGERFDVVVALHVVEHVYDPRAFVADLVDRTRDGGWVLLAAPDMGSFWRHLMRGSWPSFKIPEHVTFYDRSTLSALLGGHPHATEVVPVPYASAFPLGEVFAKLGVPAPRSERLRSMSLWIPRTTVAVAARVRRPAAGPGAISAEPPGT